MNTDAHSMNLRSLDLNLLLGFDAIYAERSISRAAAKLHLSQPAASNALARLRDKLGDPLFEREGHRMLPTLRARAIAEPIKQALNLLDQGLRENDIFDFAASDREFVVGVEDYGETVILPSFVDWLSRVAPRVRIRIRPEPSLQLRADMRNGQVDLALDYFLPNESGYTGHCVLTETLLTLSRQNHPHIGEKLTLDNYIEQPHVVLAPRSEAIPMIDLALAKRGMQRRIAVTVPHFQSMPVIVQTSDLICTIPRRMAQLYADNFRLRPHAVPLRVPQFPVYLIWHDSAEFDAGHRWFRNHLMDFCQRL